MDYKFETLQVHAGQTWDKDTHSRAVPLYQTTAYMFDGAAHAKRLFDLKEGGYIYTRLGNPTNDVFEKRMAALEGGVAGLSFASGMAAVTAAIQNIVRAGDSIVSTSKIYGGSENLFRNTFPQFGITARLVSPDDLDAIAAAIDDTTKLIFIETLGNPHGNITDVPKIAKIAHDVGIPIIVDNTFATPYLFKPIDYGADIVVHSASKFIDGSGMSLGGVIIDSGKFDWAASGKFKCLTEPDESYHGVSYTETFGLAAYITKARVTFLRDTGAALSPFNSFTYIKSLETLSLRVERHNENTKKVVAFLTAHPKVEYVNHPNAPGSPYAELAAKYFPRGAGSVFTFGVRGNLEETMRFCDKLQIFSQLTNVADAKSLVIHPATTTHSQMGDKAKRDAEIGDNTVRLSIGIENVDDLIADIAQALE